ncbi:hypothetical protein VMCG_09058 [Cytospora schulzeri]|uniref:Intradiol ring-cleavage dioxygenases domain-containing protein n=1 Tax=Cytospora schulzeri TaxID=448051 RepID=A0A423VNZ0_9PEZI|nr:hypothetical protein VMCG_09058 [Valsa malicola]
MRLSSFLAASLLAISQTVAHPETLDRSEIARRAGMSKRCEASASKFNKKRQEKRAMAKRAWGSGNTSVEIVTEAPYFDTIQNDTCVLTPDVTPGPYVWPRSQTLRQDATEDQPGIPLWLDFGVLDMDTCEPLEGVLVSFWHCNATGSYSSFTALSPNTPFTDLLTELNVTDFQEGVTDLHTDDTTWLRAMWPTDSNGLVEMKTIVPGFYVQRSIHIHVQVYNNWALHDNGTVTSGRLISTGQVYLNESMSQQAMALEPYASHTQINRTTNAEDTIFAGDTEGGYSPILDLVAIDGDIANGLVGYITMGIDTANLVSDTD